MDLPVKIAIGLFIFCLFILFFKITKQMSENYLEESFKYKVNYDEILNRDYSPQKIEKESKQQFDIPLNHLESLNPNDIKWVVKE